MAGFSMAHELYIYMLWACDIHMVCCSCARLNGCFNNFNFVIENTHHVNFNFVYNKIFGAKCTLKKWDFKYKPFITINCLPIKFFLLCQLQEPGILTIWDIEIVWYIQVQSIEFLSSGSGGRLNKSIERSLFKHVVILYDCVFTKILLNTS